MSAVTIERYPATIERYPATPVRRHLHIVGSPEESHPDVRTPGMRMTRRGRLVITLSVMSSLLVAAAVTVALVLPAGASTDVVVQPGQTLSDIAANALPAVPLDRAIVQVQLANDMNSLHVQAGQTLHIP